jgi:hypothetical protein
MPPKRPRTGNIVSFNLQSFESEQLSSLDGFEAILEKLKDEDPQGAKVLAGLSSVVRQLREAHHLANGAIRTTIAATSIDTVQDAIEYVNVDYNEHSADYELDSNFAGSTSDGKLSNWAGKLL